MVGGEICIAIIKRLQIYVRKIPPTQQSPSICNCQSCYFIERASEKKSEIRRSEKKSEKNSLFLILFERKEGGKRWRETKVENVSKQREKVFSFLDENVRECLIKQITSG